MGYRVITAENGPEAIALYSNLTAKSAGWIPESTHDIRLAAPMHDIGKIGIPDSILKKRVSLTTKNLISLKAIQR